MRLFLPSFSDKKEIDSRLGMDQGRWLQRLQLAAFRLDHPCIGEEPEPQ